jgi:hypothetical protein
VSLAGELLCNIGGTPRVPFEPLDEDYWLGRAREAYALAEQLAYPEAKRQMLEIAASYQRLAQSAQERTGRAKPRSR